MSATPARRAARALLPLLAALLLAALPPPAARAATFTVSTLSDDPNDPGSLRAAVNAAQTSADVSDTITVTAQGTITLTGGELALSNPNTIAGKTITIAGPGAGALFVSGGRPFDGTAGGSRVFHFSGLSVNVSNLAVIRGFVNSGTQSAGGVVLGGSGILQEGGALTLDHCVVEDCAANLAGAFGGGVSGANAALTLTHCVITSDSVSAFTGGGGGGIGSLLGSLTMTDCTVNFNGESGFGGGIGSLNEPLTLTRCTIVGNQILNTNGGNAYGGGVYSQNGAVTLTDCTVSGNGADTAGGGVYLKFGSATLTGCTINGNGAEGGLGQPGFQFGGGGLYIMGVGVGVTDCTFTGNSADVGGAIYNLGGALTLSDSTVARNTGDSAGSTTGAGLFVASGATATVTGTILTGNTTFNGESDVVSQGTLTSGGSNLLGDPNGNGFTNGMNHDQTGVSQAQAGVAYTLADNGGPTQTLALTATSPAIDADFADTTATDQRGAARPVGVRNDIGAFESGVTVPSIVPDTFVVTNTNDDGDGSLRRALNNADADPNAHIVFDSGVFGPGMPRTITLTSGPLVVRQNATITGPGQDLLAVSGNNASRVFDINGSTVEISANSSTANVSGLTITGGMTDSAGTVGGGIFVLGGALNLTDCTVSGNTASTQGGAGGGIENFGNATLTRCLISGNSAPNGAGGGIDNYITANLTMTDCTVVGNSAVRGGGLSGSVAGLEFLTNCTLSGNSATQGGGAYSGNALFFFNCTVSGNTATSGGGLYSASDGSILLFSSTVSANTATSGSGLYTDNSATSSVFSTIIAGNTGGANVANNGGTVTSNGSNLIGDPDGNGFTNGANSDQTGVTNPLLGPLKDNGGPTQTMALLAGSPAIDAVLTGDGGTDQRGVTRPIGARSDIGAYEYGAAFAVDDAYAVQENATLSVAAPGVLSNDVADGSALTATVQTQPAHGQLTLSGDGSFSYTPNANFLGMDSFTYQAQSANGPGNTATVTLSISSAAPPTTTASLAGTPGANGFFRSAVTVTLTASAPADTFFRVDSGPLQTYAAPFAVAGDFAHLVTFYSVSRAGVAENPNGAVTFSIDAAPPATEITSRDVPGGREVTLTGRDDFSGPGGAFFRVDSGELQVYTAPFVVRGAYDHLVTAYSIDRAGNAEGPAKSLAFTLGAPPPPDTTAPVTAPALSGPSYVNGFYRGPVTVTLTATDDASGVAGTFYRIDSGALRTYAGPFTVTGDFMHLVTFYSTDNAGNAEGPARSVTFAIDTAPPVTTLTSRAVSGGREVTLAATDDFSGPGGTFFRVDSGPLQSYSGPFVVTGAGPHLVTAYSLDRAENAEGPAKSLSFDVAP